MVDTIQNVSSVAFKLRDALKNDVRTADMVVQIMEQANTSPDIAMRGWVGVYIEKVDYSPRTAGLGQRNWNFIPQFRILVQAVDIESSENAFQKLETYVKSIIDVMMANSSLAATMEALTQVSVDYAFRQDNPDSLHFVGALVTMTFEGRSN